MKIYFVVALDFTSIPTEVYSRDNVICLNQTGPRTPIYRLTGCPDTFSSTIERIEGVCTNKTSQGIDLFMTLSQMVVGLYDFTCFTQRNSRRIFRSNYASNYAIIGKLLRQLVAVMIVLLLRCSKWHGRIQRYFSVRKWNQ